VIDSTSATTKATTKATSSSLHSGSGSQVAVNVNEDYVYFRHTAAGTPITYNGSAIMLMKGQALSVTDTSNKSWYKVNLTYSRSGSLYVPIVMSDEEINPVYFLLLYVRLTLYHDLLDVSVTESACPDIQGGTHQP